MTSASAGLLRLRPDLLDSLLRPGPISDVYFVEQTPFARGKFASVRKIRHLATGVEYAAKFIRKRRRAVDTTNEIYHEVAVLALCGDSSRLVKLHEVYDTRTDVVLVLELAAGGELQRVFDNEDLLPERDARRYMRQILEGLSHLHSHNVAHLDLKPQNLLLTADFPEGEVKLCDFGISRIIESGVEVREILGTPDYVAPEILSYEPISLATDIWSVGVLSYVLLSGGFSPFAGNTKQETFLNISQCALTFPEEDFVDVSEIAIDFIKATLVVEPKKRLSVQQCLEHPWLSNSSNIPLLPLSIEAILTPPPENYDLKLRMVMPDSNKSFETEDQEECLPEQSITLPLLKHPHKETFPDAPSTPKMSRKSDPDSPTSILNHCKLYQVDPPSKLNTNTRSKSDCGVFSSVLEICKTFETPHANINGKSHAKENISLVSNGASANDQHDIMKSDPAYAECIQCEVQCCNLVSSHKHTPRSINHVDRAILC